MLVMTLLVKNEIDIVGFNIEFHLSTGVDHIIVTDNGSDDGTRDLLSDYARLPEITVIDEPGDDYAQHRWVTRMALMAAADLSAEWILNNDADEFWLAPRGEIRAALEARAGHIQLCARRNMVGPWDDASTAPWWERLVYRQRDPKPYGRLADPLNDPLPAPHFMRALPPKAALKGEGLRHVRQGNHSADYAFPVQIETAPILIYHFPVRSRTQFESKVRQGGDAYARNSELHPKAGWHWRRWRRMLDAPGGLDATLEEALPSGAKLAKGLADGSILMDATMAAPLRELARAGPRSSKAQRL